MSKKLNKRNAVNLLFSHFFLVRKKKKSLVNSERISQQDHDFINRILFEADTENDTSDQSFEMLAVPASLHEKLLAIPVKKKRKNIKPKMLFGAGAIAASILVYISANNMQSSHYSPSKREIEEAHRELAIAFQYLNEASVKASAEVTKTMGENLQDAVVRSIFHPVET